MVDVLAVPQRLEEAVGEPQGQQVERRFLAEEVVDPEDLVLGEDLVQRVVERAGRAQVRAERLLHDHAGTLDEPGLAEHAHDRARGRRRHRQIVQAARVAPDRLFGAPDRGGQRVRARRRVAEPRAERPPAVVVDVHAAELVQRLVDVVAKGFLVELVQRGADDPVAVGHQAHVLEVVEAREQLAASQVARRPEQHQHVRLGLRQLLIALAVDVDGADGHLGSFAPAPGELRRDGGQQLARELSRRLLPVAWSFRECAFDGISE